MRKPRTYPSRIQRVRCPTCGKLTTWRKIIGVAGKAIADVHEDRDGDLCGPHKMTIDEIKERRA